MIVRKPKECPFPALGAKRDDSKLADASDDIVGVTAALDPPYV